MILNTGVTDMKDFYIPKRDFTINSINSAFVKTRDTDFYFNGEMHNFWELVYCKDGCIYASEDEKIYELSQGDVIMHKPLEFHRLWVKPQRGKNTATIMIISFSAKGNMADTLSKGVISLNLTHKHRLENTFEEIISTFDCSGIPVKKGFASPIEEHAAMLNFEHLLMSLAIETNPEKKQNQSVGAKNYRNILTVMKNCLDNNFSLEEIAAQCMLSTSNMKKTFRKYAGCGAMEYYNKLRILRACSLLKNGMSVNEISHMMNYSSPNYFSTAFKKEMGVSPSVYAK